MLVTHGDKCLLGRQKHFLPGMYSCLAGFVEAAETIEDAVRREIFEESGIRCTDVTYYMTQPWPYPSSLMIGCTARATNEDIIVDRSELEDARWFDRAEATLMIKRQHPDGLAGPHPFAIAHHLLGRWLHEGRKIMHSGNASMVQSINPGPWFRQVRNRHDGFHDEFPRPPRRRRRASSVSACRCAT